MGYGLFDSAKSRFGSEKLIRTNVLKSVKIEFSTYWKRYVRLIEHVEKGVVQYYTVELSDVGIHKNLREEMTNSYEKALKMFNNYSSVYPKKFKSRTKYVR